MNHEKLQELLPLHVLGILAPEEAGVVETHLASGCTACAEEHRTLAAAAAELAFSVTPVQPPQRLRDAILDAAAAAAVPAGAPRRIWQSWESDAPASGLSLVRASDGVWEEVLAGVRVKKLSVDRQRGLVTMLIRMAAGTAYPSHRHSHAEECLVLEGSLHVGTDVVMEAGDFQRAEPGSVHVPQYTDDGCLLLVTSSLEDELLD